MPTNDPTELAFGWAGLGVGTLLVYSAIKNKKAMDIVGESLKTGKLPTAPPPATDTAGAGPGGGGSNNGGWKPPAAPGPGAVIKHSVGVSPSDILVGGAPQAIAATPARHAAGNAPSDIIGGLAGPVLSGAWNWVKSHWHNPFQFGF